MKPKISIIVPIYNVEEYLPKCIDSILAQTLTEFELILVDDGTPDNSGKICDEYAKKDNRIKVIHKENGGVSSARNIGVDAACGEYIGFVDPDDYIRNDMYEVLYELCVKSNSEIGICKLGREIDGTIINKEEDINIKELNNIEGMRELFKGVLYRFSLCNKLFKRNCFNNVRFPEGRIHEDLSTTYKLFANVEKCVYTTYDGYIYVKRENSILTSTYNEKRLQSFIAWNEILIFMGNEYKVIYDNVIGTFTYWCMDNIYIIFNQVEDCKKKKIYIKKIQENTRKYHNEIIRNKQLNLGYKVRVLLLNISVNAFIFINKAY